MRLSEADVKNTGEILRAAARRVRQGWCQHGLTDYQGGVCAQGAVMDVLWGNPEHLCASTENRADYRLLSEIFAPVHRALGATRSKRPQPTVKNWNNAKGQTAENVAQTLELAAILWDEEQAASERPRASRADGLQPLAVL